jgi:PAS domain S-box-containing protein
MPYEEYFKAASEGLIVVDRRGRILEANRKAEQLFGYSQEELAGQPVELLVPTQIGELLRGTCVTISVRHAAARWAVASPWRRGVRTVASFP